MSSPTPSGPPPGTPRRDDGRGKNAEVFSTDDEEDSPSCRICWALEDSAALLSPCLCTGGWRPRARSRAAHRHPPLLRRRRTSRRRWRPVAAGSQPAPSRLLAARLHDPYASAAALASLPCCHMRWARSSARLVPATQPASCKPASCVPPCLLCAAAGTQKHVHLKCLRRWQESVQRRDIADGAPHATAASPCPCLPSSRSSAGHGEASCPPAHAARLVCSRCHRCTKPLIGCARAGPPRPCRARLPLLRVPHPLLGASAEGTRRRGRSHAGSAWAGRCARHRVTGLRAVGRRRR